MKLLLVKQAKVNVSATWLQSFFKKLARALAQEGFKGLGRKELVVVLVKPSEIRRLNLVYRHKDYVTDILSFQPVDDSSVGELVICLPVILQQSRKAGHSQRRELSLMLIHGVLHLLGFDHMRIKDEVKMFALQAQLLERLTAD